MSSEGNDLWGRPSNEFQGCGMSNGEQGTTGTYLLNKASKRPMAMYGATPKGGQTEFRVWAPKAQRIQLRVLDGSVRDRQMEHLPNGDFQLTTDAQPGDRYFYLVDDDPLQLPDPVSRVLPEGVHGPTQIVDPDEFRWTDQN